MKTLLLLAYLALCVGLGHRIAPFWKDDQSLWGRTVDVAPHHARAMVNLADAYAKRAALGVATTTRTTGIGTPELSVTTSMSRTSSSEQDIRSALFWAASARQHAKDDWLLPERERRTVIMAANSDMVSILLTQKPANAPLITELLEEIWQLQSASSAK